MTDPTTDERTKMFAAHVHSLRQDMNLTQTDLARQMKERGFSFHQQTIQRIEDLERPVRLDEAYALAAILKSSVDKMAWSDDTVRASEVDHFMFGASSVTTGVIRGAEEWYEDGSRMIGHLEYLAANDPESRRLHVGVALLTKMNAAITAMYELMGAELGDVFLRRHFEVPDDEPIFGNAETDDVDLSGTIVTDGESAFLRARKLLSSVTPSPELLEMSAYDLQDLYVAAGWKPGHTVGGPRKI